MDEECSYNSGIKKRMKLIEIIVIILFLILCIISLLNYNSLENKTEQTIQNYGFVGLFLITALLEIVPSVLNGVVGLWAATATGMSIHISMLVAIVGSILGSYIGFIIGEKYGFKYVCAMFEKETVDKILKFWEKYGKSFILIAAITPLPYVPIIFGALGLSKKEFVIWGIIPRIFNYIIYGYGFALGFTELIKLV